MQRTQRIRIFVSSPGDVLAERRAAQEVIQRLDREFAPHFHVDGVFWEQDPLVATEHFQTGIVSPSQVDVVIAILWSRLGQPMPPMEFPGAITGRTVTGTEYEWEAALKAWRKRKWPKVLFYRKLADAPIKVADARQRRELNDQLDQVDEFIRRWFIDEKTGAYKKAYRDFTTTEQFSDLAHTHLTTLLTRSLRAPGSRRSTQVTVDWHQGSPFRGLQSFEFAHSPIFFGRTRARNELREALAQRATAGCGFLAVVGASGSGKSSLVKAGLLPDLTTPGLMEGVGLCRFATLRPSDQPGDGRHEADGLRALAAALLVGQALPELGTSGHDVESLTSLLRTADADAILAPVGAGLAQAGRERGLVATAAAKLAVMVDQLEELFTHSFSQQNRERFMWVLAALARSSQCWVIGTLRSDFLDRAEQIPALAVLTGGAGSWVLHPPSDAEIGEMIRFPAQAAGLRFQVNARTGERLDELIRAEAANSPASLPLLEYLLEQLWHRRTPTGILTFRAYRQLGGLGGVLGRRAEEVYARLPEVVRGELPRTLRALVTIAPGNQTAATTRSALLAAFAEGTPSHELVTAFLDPSARLLVADRDQLRIAHESLLRHWQRAADLIVADRDDLQARARIEEDWRGWLEADPADADSLLLPAGLRLDEAEQLLKRRPEDLSAEVAEYIRRSRSKHIAEVARLDWLRLRAESASLKAQAEESFARAQRNELLAERVESQAGWPEREQYLRSLLDSAGQFRANGQARWRESYQRDQQLRSHPGAPAAEELRAAPADALLKLEVLDVGYGDCLLLHYGSRDAVKLVLIDGGVPFAFRDKLKPRLEELGSEGRAAGHLDIELVIVTHPHHDHVGGVTKLVEHLHRERERAPIHIRRLWFNNFLPIGAEHFLRKEEQRGGDELVVLARLLGIPLNRPFDYYVMPSEIGPARVSLAGGLDVTVLGPSLADIQRLARHQHEDAWKKQDRHPPSLIDQLGGTLAEGFSSPEIVLLRAPPDQEPPSPVVRTWSEVNEASIISLFEFHGRRVLLPGDAHGDSITQALYAAGHGAPGERVHLDLMMIPHMGSFNSVSAEFFQRVTADHYLVAGSYRFMLPKPELIHVLAEARRGEAFTLHVALGKREAKVRELLEQAIKKEKRKAEVRFRPAPGRSIVVELLGGA